MGGSPKGTLSVCPADDSTNLDPTFVAILSNLGLEVNNNRVLAVVRVAGISWDAMADAGLGIGVVGGVALGSGATLSVNRAISFSCSILSMQQLLF